MRDVSDIIRTAFLILLAMLAVPQRDLPADEKKPPVGPATEMRFPPLKLPSASATHRVAFTN